MHETAPVYPLCQAPAYERRADLESANAVETIWWYNESLLLSRVRLESSKSLCSCLSIGCTEHMGRLSVHGVSAGALEIALLHVCFLSHIARLLARYGRQTGRTSVDGGLSRLGMSRLGRIRG